MEMAINLNWGLARSCANPLFRTSGVIRFFDYTRDNATQASLRRRLRIVLPLQRLPLLFTLPMHCRWEYAEPGSTGNNAELSIDYGSSWQPYRAIAISV
jgi:hypothetical protein